MLNNGGALDVIEKDHSLRCKTIEVGMNCKTRRHSVPTKVEPWLTSIELWLARNVHAGHESLRDITFVGCAAPYTQASLWNRSTKVAVIKYAASVTANAFLWNLIFFFEKLDISSDWLQQLYAYESHL
jgi:hypothetical protein